MKTNVEYGLPWSVMVRSLVYKEMAERSRNREGVWLKEDRSGQEQIQTR